MKHVVISIVLVILFNTNLYAIKPDSVYSISKKEFESGIQCAAHGTDNNIYKINGVLKISDNCPALKDVSTDVRFLSHEYIGNIVGYKHFIIVKNETYNSDDFTVFNTKTCESYNFAGEPFVFLPYIISGNESETTDKRMFLEIWQIVDDRLKKVSKIELPNNVDPDVFKLSNNKAILIKDVHGGFWKVLTRSIKS